ncbi:MAG: glycosyltransferase family 9 protein [Alphaproteobacteria bacterium]|nr:glycosyltransferase family 9 protein [Alphaproteobacteria bacterium]
MPARAPRSICVYVGLDRVGDGLMKLPFLRALRAAWPDARVTWLAGKGRTVFAHDLAPLAQGLIDEVVEDAGIGSRGAELLRRPLAGRRFDLVIDTQRRVLTALIVRRIAHDVFVSGAAGFLLSDRRPPAARPKPKAMVRQMLDLIEAAAGAPARPDAPLRLDAASTDAARRLLPDGAAYVGLAPGAGGRHKCWPLDRFVELAQRIAKSGRVPVFILGPGEGEWSDPCRAVPGARLVLQDAAAQGIAVTPMLTIALARRLAAAVANDSGAGHMLAAADIPLVSLFGPTAPEKFAPMTMHLTLLRAQDFDGAAMDAIPVEAVERALAARVST